MICGESYLLDSMTKPHDTAFGGLESGNIAVVVADDTDAKSSFCEAYLQTSRALIPVINYGPRFILFLFLVS